MESHHSDIAPLPDANITHWFSAEVQPHEGVLRSYLRGSFPALRDVDDVVQESYLRIWRARKSTPIRFAKAFLFSVARHIAVDLLRRESRSPILAVKEIGDLFVLDELADASSSAAAALQIELLSEAITTLPSRCREIFILCQVEGRPQREVAVSLGLSENTVAVQSARGLQRCEAFVRRRLNHQ